MSTTQNPAPSIRCRESLGGCFRRIACLGLTGLLAMIAWFGPEVTPGHTRSFTDQIGRRVTLENNPARIVTLAPSLTEIVFALGQGHRLVGVTRFSDYPPAALNIERVGSYVQLDLEKIVALAPDLCLATRDGNPKETVDRLVGLGIPVFTVHPRDMPTTLAAIEDIARILGVPRKGESITRRMAERIAVVRARVQGTAERPGVFFQIGMDPIVSAGSATFIHELITLAGGRNLAAGPSAYPRFNREQVVALNPDVIVVTTMAREGGFDAVLATWRRWPAITAVRHGRLHKVDSNLFDRAGPRLVDALEMLAAIIHPRLAGEERHGP